MESLVSHYRHEATVPDFTGVAMVGERVVAREQFKGRSTQSSGRDLPMADLAATAPAGTTRAVDLHARRCRNAVLHNARLRYASIRCSSRGSTTESTSSVSFAPYVETDAPGADDVQGGGPDYDHAHASTDERTALRRRDRSTASRLRAARVLVRHHGTVDRHGLGPGRRAGVMGDVLERGGF